MVPVYWLAACMVLIPAVGAGARLMKDRSLAGCAFALSMTAMGASLALAAAVPAVPLAASHGPAAWVSGGLGVTGTWALAGTLAAANGGIRRFADMVMTPVLAGVSVILLLLGLHLAGRCGGQDAVASSGLRVIAAQLALLTYFGPGLFRIAALARQCSGCVPEDHARAGMLAVSVSARAELVLTVARSAVIIARASGMPDGTPVITVIAGMQGCAVILGIGLLAAGPAAALISSRCRLWLWYWRLRPLWVTMLRAAPQVELSEWQHWRLGIRWLLLRRVIEIRDAELALRPHWRAEIAVRASAAARSAALDADLEQAVVEAAVIMDAADARLRGAPPSDDQIPAESICTRAGDDLHSEVASLILVSTVIRRCHLIRELQAGAPRHQ